MAASWPVVGESVVSVMLWVLLVVLACLNTVLLVFHITSIVVFVGILGVLHVMLNVWLVSILRGTLNTVVLVSLSITQTTPFFLLCRRAFLAMRSGCERDPAAHRLKVLQAKYALMCETSCSHTKLEEVEQHAWSSCVPDQPDAVPGNNNEAPPPTLETPPVKVLDMKFQPNTKTIKLSLDTPEDIYGGERSFYKFISKNIQSLLIEEKRLSYHIVTDPAGSVIHVSRSATCAEALPDRVLRQEPLTLCSDVHYIVNFIRGVGYQTTQVTRRHKHEELRFTQNDVSKTVWLLVWPCTVAFILSFMEALTYNNPAYCIFCYDHNDNALGLVTPVVGVVVWLVTQRYIDDPWRNTCILVFLRLCFTVSRTVLVCAMVITWGLVAVFVILCAKLAGVLTLATQIAHAKIRKNVELYSDPADKYSFNTTYEPLVQASESLVYCAFAIGWHVTSPAGPAGSTASLILMLVVVVCHVWGMAWLWFMRNFLKDPLTDPIQVLQIVKDRVYSRT